MSEIADPVDHLDGHVLRQNDPADDAPPPTMLARETLDGFVNQLTGLGDPSRDKTLGGRLSGPEFYPNFLTGAQIENRWRGSDLGARIVETLPDEMTREGIEFTTQPTQADARRDSRKRRRDADGQAAALLLTQGARPPGELPEQDDDGKALVEALELQDIELGTLLQFKEALNYERAYGGGAILLGVDDGGMDLTTPLDETRIKSINFINAYRGGWDGEILAWRYYNDPRKANFGMPAVYQLRNLGVPISSPPAPGEKVTQAFQPTVTSTGGPILYYVHESRLLVFPGVAVSRRARVQMRGWGDSIFTRVNEVLAQYGQTWQGVSVLMQEWAQGVLQIDGLAASLATNSVEGQGLLMTRALALQLSQSVARMRIIDSKEKFSREVTPLSGVAEVLQQFALRLAAAADMPVALLMGQAPAGLNATGASDIRFFYDRIASRQNDRMMPQWRRFKRLQMLSKSGPTHGHLPDRWRVEPRGLYQATDSELADIRYKQSQTDSAYLDRGVVTPEEIAGSRFGGSQYSVDTTIDPEGRAAAAKLYQQQQEQRAAQAQKLAEAQAKNPPAQQQLALGAGQKPQGAPAGQQPAEPPHAALTQQKTPEQIGQEDPATPSATAPVKISDDDGFEHAVALIKANARITHAALRGHGLIIARIDGVRARCGGKGLCVDCRLDAEAVDVIVQHHTDAISRHKNIEES